MLGHALSRVLASGRQEALPGPARGTALPVGLPVIRIKLYGIDGREHSSYELEEGNEHLVIQPKPLFTLERIVVNPPEQQELRTDA